MSFIISELILNGNKSDSPIEVVKLYSRAYNRISEVIYKCHKAVVICVAIVATWQHPDNTNLSISDQLKCAGCVIKNKMENT
jgi:hypothetical protein